MAGMVTRPYIDERRRQFMSSERTDIPETELGRLYRRAVTEYGSTCLWNCRPTASDEGMTLIAERLQKYGDLRAWYLADEILKVVESSGNVPGFSPV